MRKISLSVFFVVFMMMAIVGCSGKSSTIEGKVVDGKGQPLANVKVAAKMSQPIKGYEQFETTTGTDGAFKFGKLFPTSEYQFIFFSDRWMTEKKMKIDTGTEGQIKILPEPVMIRFMDSKAGVVVDTKTDLMWETMQSGSPVNWSSAKNYCENHRGAGYTDWRMPTQDELVELCKNDNYKNIAVLDNVVWASETRGSMAATVDFHYGTKQWQDQSEVVDIFFRRHALPVRSNK